MRECAARIVRHDCHACAATTRKAQLGESIEKRNSFHAVAGMDSLTGESCQIERVDIDSRPSTRYMTNRRQSPRPMKQEIIADFATRIICTKWIHSMRLASRVQCILLYPFIGLRDRILGFRKYFHKTEYDLNAKRSAFAKEFMQHLLNMRPEFSVEKVAALCSSTNLLEMNQSGKIANIKILPEWLVDELLKLFPHPRKIPNNASQSYELQTLYESGNLTLTPPVAQFVRGSRTKSFTHKLQSTPKMYSIKGNHSTHFIFGASIVSWSSDGIIYHANENMEFKKLRNLFANLLFDLDPMRLTGSTFLSAVSGNYIHWLLDTLPKLIVLAESEVNINSFDNLVFYDNRRALDKQNFTDLSFVQQSFAELGIQQKRVKSTETLGPFFHTEEYTWVSSPRVRRVICKDVPDSLCSFFGLARNIQSGKRKIFISRDKARKRRILNEDELFEHISPYGYERVYLEDISIRETARMFSNAEAVIAPHGAGLANIVFSPPDTKVLELFGEHLTRSYYMLACQKRLKYFAFEACRPRGVEGDCDKLNCLNRAERNALDMVIPMNIFRDFFENEFMGN